MRLIIDTDLGMGTVGSDPEDGMAILYALNTPGVKVDGVTLVQGNVPISHSWPNARHLLTLAGYPDLPVHAGAVRPATRTGATYKPPGWISGPRLPRPYRRSSHPTERSEEPRRHLSAAPCSRRPDR